MSSAKEIKKIAKTIEQDESPQNIKKIPKKYIIPTDIALEKHRQNLEKHKANEISCNSPVKEIPTNKQLQRNEKRPETQQIHVVHSNRSEANINKNVKSPAKNTEISTSLSEVKPIKQISPHAIRSEPRPLTRPNAAEKRIHESPKTIENNNESVHNKITLEPIEDTKVEIQKPQLKPIIKKPPIVKNEIPIIKSNSNAQIKHIDLPKYKIQEKAIIKQSIYKESSYLTPNYHTLETEKNISYQRNYSLIQNNNLSKEKSKEHSTIDSYNKQREGYARSVIQSQQGKRPQHLYYGNSPILEASRPEIPASSPSGEDMRMLANKKNMASSPEKYNASQNLIDQQKYVTKNIQKQAVPVEIPVKKHNLYKPTYQNNADHLPAIKTKETLPKRNIYSVECAKREYLVRKNEIKPLAKDYSGKDYLAKPIYEIPRSTPHINYQIQSHGLARLEAVKNSLHQKYEKLQTPSYRSPPISANRYYGKNYDSGRNIAKIAGLAVVGNHHSVQPQWWG